METGESIPQREFERHVMNAQEQLKTISKLREKLEILTEHVESRKGALEEEIEESLHESIRNARDCLEKIQENIVPKLERVVEDHLDKIDVQMNRWKEESLDAVRREIQKESPVLSQKVLASLDHLLEDKLKAVKTELSAGLDKEVESKVGPSVAEMTKSIRRIQGIGYAALGASALALMAAAWLAFR